MWRLKAGDEVVVTAGAEKGKTGKVMSVDLDRDRVTVQGVNLRYKHIRRSQQYPQGGRIQKEIPIHVSNVMLLDPSSGKPTRVRMGTDDKGKKARISVRSGKPI